LYAVCGELTFAVPFPDGGNGTLATVRDLANPFHPGGIAVSTEPVAVAVLNPDPKVV